MSTLADRVKEILTRVDDVPEITGDDFDILLLEYAPPPREGVEALTKHVQAVVDRLPELLLRHLESADKYSAAQQLAILRTPLDLPRVFDSPERMSLTRADGSARVLGVICPSPAVIVLALEDLSVSCAALVHIFISSEEATAEVTAQTYVDSSGVRVARAHTCTSVPEDTHDYRH